MATVRGKRPDCKCSRQNDQARRPCVRGEQNTFPDPPTFGSLPCSARACRPSKLAVMSCPKGSVIPGPGSQGLTSWAWEGCTGAPCFWHSVEATPLPREMSSASSHPPSCKGHPPQAWRPGPCSGPWLPTIPGTRASRAAGARAPGPPLPGSVAHGGEVLCREEMAQTRYRFVCFPCEEKRPFYFPLLFIF